MGRRSIARAGAAVLAGSVAMLVAALPAAADTPAHGKIVDGDSDSSGYKVRMSGEDSTLHTKMFSLQLDDGSKLKMFCVQIDVGLDTSHGLTEQPWDNYPDKNLPFNQNRNKINWVLHNSYPVSDLDAITAASGITFHDGLSTAEAITATQVSVWHFSDGRDFQQLADDNATQDSQTDVKALYDYLTGAKNVGIAENENPSLAITPATAKGKAGEKLGPFTIKTNGTVKELTGSLPEGVKITDAKGKEIAAGSLKNGSKVYLDVPADAADGSAQLTVKANAHFDTGRLFVGDNYGKKPSQTLIVATGSDTALEASAKANWTETAPAPQGSSGGGALANTGASVFVPILVGVLLVGAGVGALLFQRRRRAS